MHINDLLKMGVRVEAVHHTGPSRAWVLVTGRNLDGSTYRFSQLRILNEGRWLELAMPYRTELDSLPEGFPPPMYDFTDFEEGLQLGRKTGSRLPK